MDILVKIVNQYGQDRIYPVCEKAKLLTKLSGKATLTKENIQTIKELGYTVQVQQTTL